MDETKSYEISKHVVLEAFQRVKANKGAAGIDGEDLEAFEGNLKNNLYKIWNRMSSGSYFPPAVGETAALRTLNPRLVIVGGISILGTSGIVRTMSEEAFKTSILPELDQAVAYGHKTIVLNSNLTSPI